MGVVYHSRFLEYFEVIRTEFVRTAGLPYSKMEEQGVMLPVSSVEIRFKRPIQYDELMDARMHIFDEPTVRLITWYDIRPKGANQPHILGKVELVFVDVETRRPVRAPKVFLQKIHDYAAMA